MMKTRLESRIAALEAKTKPRVISSWVDFVLWLDAHENDDGEIEVDLSSELQALVETMLPGAEEVGA